MKVECKCGNELGSDDVVKASGEVVWHLCKKCGLYNKWYIGKGFPLILERGRRLG